MILGVAFTEEAVIGLLVAAVQFATLLYLAALGETISEKAGVLNLGVEGMMATGAAVGFIAGVETGSPWLGLIAGSAAGMVLSMLHAFTSVGLGADQVVSGLALTFLGLGFADFIGDGYTDDERRARFADVEIPGLDDIPYVGEILFRHSPVTYLAVISGIAAWFILNRTAAGLGLRAVGETASTADAAGHSVLRLRFVAVGVGGAFAGASGAYLTTYLVGSWSQNLTAGRGWIAVALVIFGAWRPGRVAIGALLFGFTLALKSRLVIFEIDFSPRLLDMAPYLLTIVVLVLISYRARNRPSPAPAAIGIPYRREER
ncbi:MAG: ABC transporter permease [Acidimicrobiales bacterium]|nr:ABC transporter permease [Acidimicrobiales bacterium]